MTFELYIRLIVYTAASFVLIYVVQIPFRKIKNRLVKAFMFLLKMFGTLFLGLTLIAFDFAVVWRHEYIFGALYLALLPDVFMDIVTFLVTLFKKG